MGSFGERLRREREMRGISLDEIAVATKISARNLHALEDEKFNQLPGGIFNKGFVRAYAKFLGIDQEQMVAEYETASQETEAAREQKLKDAFSKAEFRKQKKDDDDREISLEPKSQWGTIAIIVLIAALAYGGYSIYQRRKLDKLQQAQASTPSVKHTPLAHSPTATPVAPTSPENAVAASAQPSAVPNAQSPPASSTNTTKNAKPDSTKLEPSKSETAKPANQKSDTATAPTNATSTKLPVAGGPPFELKIKINQQSWVSIKADGKTILNTTLNPGTERSFKATDKIEMILGNAGGVEVSYNGKPVENLNTGQDVRKLTFTASGYE